MQPAPATVSSLVCGDQPVEKAGQLHILIPPKLNKEEKASNKVLSRYSLLCYTLLNTVN